MASDPERPSTVPPPELNPLLNPVLGKNMGRWAEVYFTSPPEKREEAVLQLIQELEHEDPSVSEHQADAGSQSSFQKMASRRPASAVTEAEDSESSASAAAPASLLASGVSNDSAGVTCFWCGYINRAEYRFCGRCGETLPAQHLNTPQVPDNDARDNDVRDDIRSSHRIYDRSGASGAHRDSEAGTGDIHERETSSERYDSAERELPPVTEAASETEYEREYDRTYDEEPSKASKWASDPVPRILPSLDPAGPDEFLRRRMDYGTSRLESESSSRSLRPWIVAALVIVGLAYVAWRGTSYRTSYRTPSPAAANAPNQSQAETATPAPADNEPVTQTPAAKTTPAAATPAASAPAPDPTATSLPGKGLEELDQARDFLDGRNGKQHNPTEAAEWLWRAVRKQNAEATVLLAGLYLRGEGVGKNCDQARLLLDAAASKGRKDAAQELQNLPAFGCQ